MSPSAYAHLQPPTPLSVGAYVAGFMEDLTVLHALGDRKLQTLRTYASCAKHSVGVHRVDDAWLVDVRCPLLARPVAELTVTEVRAWHRAVATSAIKRARHNVTKGTRVANQALVLLGLSIRRAEEDRVMPIGSSPTRFVDRFRQAPRERYLTDPELRAVWTALDKVERMRVRDARPMQRRYARNVTQALRLCLLLALRKSEALRLEWSMVFIDEKVLRLPDTKTGYREVSLSNEAIEVLLVQARGKTDQWVFPSRVKRGVPIGEAYKVWRTVLDVSGIDPTGVVIHTARHSLATNSLRRGEPIEHASRLLGHKNTNVTETVYGSRRLATKGTDALVQTHADRIVRAA